MKIDPSVINHSFPYIKAPLKYKAPMCHVCSVVGLYMLQKDKTLENSTATTFKEKKQRKYKFKDNILHVCAQSYQNT